MGVILFLLRQTINLFHDKSLNINLLQLIPMKILNFFFIGFIGLLSLEGYNQIIPDFTEHLISDEFYGVSALSVCDVDQDGVPDVVGASEYAQGIGAKGISWWRDNGNGFWDRHIIDTTYPNIMSLQTIDINQDGNIDVLVSDWALHKIAYWTSDGTNPPNWTKTEMAGNFYQAHDAVAADIDGNGYLDIVGVAAYLGIVRAWFQSSDGSWSTQLVDNSLSDARAVCVVDVDNDNDLDILAAATGSTHTLKLYFNGGGNPIQWDTVTIDNESGGHSLQGVDLDKDGDQDILVAEPVSGKIFWWRNEGGNPIGWVKEPIADLESAVRAVSGDLNDDDEPDVLGTGKFSSELSAWYNQSGSSSPWTKDLINDEYQHFWPSYMADMDGDTDLDFVAGAGGSGIISWWENQLITTNTNEVPNDPQFSVFPNPFCEQTVIEYCLEDCAEVHLQIFNLQGKLVKMLIEKNQNPGQYCIYWNGKDEEQRNVPSGLYLCRLLIDDHLAIQRIVKY
jgi:hypothetical protein